MSETSLREYCGQIDGMIEQGRFAEAATHGKHILKQYPRYLEAYRLLGKAMLEAGQDEYAVDMFRRVLSANPEDLVAWVGLSEVHNKNDELDAAIWYLERAFELAADNKPVAEELRRLYSRRDGVDLQKTPLTTGALARLYLKGNLLSRAINDFRAILAEHPDRVDLRVALAEALWRNDQRLEAADVCQQILDELPYCLKANLILGSIWVNSGRDEGQEYLRRADALDPENKMALELFGDDSPLPARQVQIVPLEYRPVTEEERPAWMAEVEGVSTGAPPLTDKEASLVDITAALEAQIEIPSWLEEIAVEEEEIPAPPIPGPVGLPEVQLPEEVTPVPAEEIPTWLMAAAPGGPEEEESKEAAVAEEEEPEWLAGLGLEPIGDEEEEEGELPEWLDEPGEGAAEEAPPALSQVLEAPEWLSGLTAETAIEEAAPAVSTVEQPSDWLSGLREQFVEEPPAMEEVVPSLEEAPPAEISGVEEPSAAMQAPVLAEIPDWLQKIAPSEAQPAPAPVAEEVAGAEPSPAWLEGEGVPSGDEALAWLEQLAEGKEEELGAQIKAESEVRMAEIMGRPAPAEPAIEEPVAVEPAPAPAEIPDWLQELAPSEITVPEAPVSAEEAAAPPVEGMLGWTAFGELEAPPEVTPAVETVPLVEQVLPPEEIAAPQAFPPVEEIRWDQVRAAVEEVTPTPVIEMEAPPVPPEPEIAPPVEAPVDLAVEPFAVERAYLEENPRDYKAWLSLARALWQADERTGALEAYARVIRSGKLVESVIPDLEGYVEQWPDVHVQQILGDAYMKDGRLQEALSLYRQALEKL